MSTSKTLNNNITAIILCAGSGTRMNSGKNKMLLEYKGKPIYQITLEKFKKYFSNIILVSSSADLNQFDEKKLGVKLVCGGLTRQESVLNALKAVKTERVLIHDGARCLVGDRIIEDCINSKASAFFVAMPLKNTIRYDSTQGFKTLDRTHLLDVQTPQGGITSLFLSGASFAFKENIAVTDDISMIETEDIEVINGEESNFKLTTPFDLKLMKMIEDGCDE